MLLALTSGRRNEFPQNYFIKHRRKHQFNYFHIKIIQNGLIHLKSLQGIFFHLSIFYSIILNWKTIYFYSISNLFIVWNAKVFHFSTQKRKVIIKPGFLAGYLSRKIIKHHSIVILHYKNETYEEKLGVY